MQLFQAMLFGKHKCSALFEVCFKDSSVLMQVAYVSSPIMRVNVRAIITGQEGLVTNDFTIAFKQQRGQVTPVVPETIQDAWLYIHAYRQHLLEQVGHEKSNFDL